jgi:hypothetical protein
MLYWRSMDRRGFLKNVALTTAGADLLGAAEAVEPASETDGHTLVGEFKLKDISWKVYEDLRTREGAITFVPSHGAARTLAKSAEAAFAEAHPPNLGLSVADIGTAGPDLLADRLLEHGGDPDLEVVKSAAPPRDPPRLPSAAEDASRGTTSSALKSVSTRSPCFLAATRERIIPPNTFQSCASPD